MQTNAQIRRELGWSLIPGNMRKDIHSYQFSLDQPSLHTKTDEAKDPINLIASDQPTTCPYDGARTQWITTKADKDNEWHDVERCLHCERTFHVYDDKEPF